MVKQVFKHRTWANARGLHRRAKLLPFIRLSVALSQPTCVHKDSKTMRPFCANSFLPPA